MEMFEETAKHPDDSLLSGIIECLESAILEDAYHKIFKNILKYDENIRKVNCKCIVLIICSSDTTR